MAADARDDPAQLIRNCQQLIDIRLIHRICRKLRAIQQVGVAGDGVPVFAAGAISAQRC